MNIQYLQEQGILKRRMMHLGGYIYRCVPAHRWLLHDGTWRKMQKGQ
jgi:hypothetical protein